VGSRRSGHKERPRKKELPGYPQYVLNPRYRLLRGIRQHGVAW